MSKFNARVAQVKLQNYNTPPQNLPQFQNPFLLLSDTEALNQILKDKGGSPNVPAVNETPYAPPVDMPSGLIPTNPSEPTGLNPADQPSGLVPTAEPSAPVSGGAGRSHPSESMPNRFANLDDEDGDMDSDAHSGPRPPDAELNLNENVNDDEGHSQVIPAQDINADGATVSSGPNLIVDGKINRAIGLPPSVSSSLATSNGKPLKQVIYNPSSGKYTLYYGTRLASGNYPTKVELSAPPPPAQSVAWYRQAALGYYQATLDPRSGANYMLDRINSRGSN